MTSPQSNAPSVHTHVYPVDLSMTADEAWRELCIFGQRGEVGEPRLRW